MIEEVMSVLYSQVREPVKKAIWTTLIIIDSQAMQNTCNASIASKGYCFYKSTKGIKWHLAVDTLGFPFFTHCTKANLSDDAGLIETLTQNIDGYHPEHLTKELEQIYHGTRFTEIFSSN